MLLRALCVTDVMMMCLCWCECVCVLLCVVLLLSCVVAVCALFEFSVLWVVAVLCC